MTTNSKMISEAESVRSSDCKHGQDLESLGIRVPDIFGLNLEIKSISIAFTSKIMRWLRTPLRPLQQLVADVPLERNGASLW